MMEQYLSDKVKAIKPSGIRKFFDLASAMDDVISLGVGEPDFDTPWHIREAAIYSIESGKTFYTANQGLKELRVEICRYMKRRFQLDYQPDANVVVTVGGSEGIDIALRAIVNPGDEVILMQPNYVAYEPGVQLAGGKPVFVELKEEDQFNTLFGDISCNMRNSGGSQRVCGRRADAGQKRGDDGSITDAERHQFGGKHYFFME